ncbi:N-acetylmannosamine kinase [Photobacterium rosenbergii]|uniref:N-acetylmannosamine kinase n=1 Tax=Photobacterium rosenbergii TaxID=294936 RepID=UPI001C99D306|nr:N-acetylmannosamine kinase [Photobacterium rosenbergii]MBY5943699.1 N-acetylmannosamine kinase [Photobacterium rosenbergii]
MTTYLAVDLGGTKLAAALVADGVLSARQQLDTQSDKSPEVLRQNLATLLASFHDQADQVVVASTGIIQDGRLTALNPQNLGGLDHFPIKAEIEAITGLPTLVLNDAQAAAWAEYHAAGGQYANMAFITVSTGVGAGLVIDGQLQIGARGIAGHAGHSLADPNGPVCGCGRKGCVEAIASGTAIGQQGSEVFGENCTGQEVYQRYLAGDEAATTIVSRSATAIAQLVADLTITNDLDAVVIGGGVGLAANYLELVEEALSSLPAVYQPKLLPAKCSTDAGLIGAALWAQACSQR